MKNKYTLNEYIKHYDFFTDHKLDKVKRVAKWVLTIIGYILGAIATLCALWLMMLCVYAMG